AWLTWLTSRAGALPDGFTASWLLAAALALPPVVVGLWLSRQLAKGAPEVVKVLTGGIAAAAGVAAGALAQQLLGGSGLATAAQLPRDLALALPVALVTSALAHVLLFAVPVPSAATLRRTGRRLVAQFAVLALAGGAMALAAGQPATAATVTPTADNPCPDGTPTRTYDVQAINVNIPLNRFGDHDPKGRMYALTSQIGAIRDQEATQKVQIGLRNDAIQPLVIRANEGDCVTITYTNNATGGDFGMHIDGLVMLSGSSGDAVGRNLASNPTAGETKTYTYYVPEDASLEGAHYLHPGAGFRDFVNHGLFGSLVVEPPGSTYVDPNGVDEAHTVTAPSGWEMTIKPYGRPSFRENVQLYHEIGNENEKDAVLNKNNQPLPFVDPHTDAYRPGTRAISYRTEPFYDRLEPAPDQEAHAYGSYTFGDPATPMPRGYLGDPTKFRILHAGSEMFHVFHMHGGGIRWRFNPVADSSYDYAHTGLNKYPVEASDSERLDSQSFGPGESYNLEIEGGAGGVQQGAGDFLFHCHIAEHYVAGMWSFWRVYDTRQPEFAPLADRTDPPAPVESTALIGKTINGQTITAANLDDWIRPQLPSPGVRKNAEDATVWNWGTNPANPAQYLGEPEDKTSWVDYYNTVPGHATALPVDRFVGDRPVLLFNPLNGRPAYPLMRPHLGIRPPFSPSGHSGAPYLGELGATAPKTAGTVDPYAGRTDAICPAKRADGSPEGIRRFNIVAIEHGMQVSAKDYDPVGKVFVLAHDKDAVLSGAKPMQPLAIRANVGDCVATTLTSELTDKNAADGFSQVNMHIHHVQFDTQASDGVITGMSYEQAVRPYKAEDPQLADSVAKGSTVLHLTSVAKFQKGVWLGVGLGTDGPAATGTLNASASGQGPEVRQITAVDQAANTITLDRPLEGDHAAGQWAGVEFVQGRWYPDVDLDNIFWHDHVDGIHTWAHGLVSQLIIEPRGSTYHDPRSGAEVDSGPIVDIHTNNALAPATGVKGSYRELALLTIDKGFGNTLDSTLNMRANPLADRTDPTGDASLKYSSYKWGDPITPLPRAYPKDPVVIRTVNVGPTVDTLHIDGHNFSVENRETNPDGTSKASTTDTIHYGISEKFTVILGGGAGGKNGTPGDYLYFNGINRRTADGAWGLIRVLPGKVTSDPGDPNYLRPLPGATTPGTVAALPTQTGGRPPVAGTATSPCAPGANVRAFDVTAVPVRSQLAGAKLAFVPSSIAAGVIAGTTRPDPLILHVA
ncbi:MAG: hypothetical protein QOJ50_514, partial [Cryptosporangiaceae bacterium]|nr:hypothetical protein [Cryptosporangiaceae bacterium]